MQQNTSKCANSDSEFCKKFYSEINKTITIWKINLSGNLQRKKLTVNFQKWGEIKTRKIICLPSFLREDILSASKEHVLVLLAGWSKQCRLSGQRTSCCELLTCSETHDHCLDYCLLNAICRLCSVKYQLMIHKQLLKTL